MGAGGAGAMAAHRAALGLPGGAAGGPPPGEEAVRRAWRRAAARLHPDKGGCPQEFARARAARDALLAAVARHRAALRAIHRPVGPLEPAPAKPARQAPAAPLELREGEDGAELVPGEDLAPLAEEALDAGEFGRAEGLADAALAFGRPPAAAAGAAGGAAAPSPLAYFGRLHLLRARARGALGRWAPALEDGERATRLMPRLPAAWIARCIAAGETGRLAEAARCLARAEDLLASDPGALAGLEDALVPLPLPEQPGGGGDGGLLARLLGWVRAELLRKHCVAAVERAHGAGGVAVLSLAFQPLATAQEPCVGEGSRDGSSPLKVATVGADGSLAVFSVPDGVKWGSARPRRGSTSAGGDGGGGDRHPFTGASALAWCPDGRDLLASASADGTARLWAAGRNRLGVVRDFRGGHAAPLTHVAFSPDGARLATCGADGSACVWDAGSGLLEHALVPGHRARVNEAVFSPCGGLLVTASDDETARVWELREGPGGAPGGSGRLPGECLHTLSWDSGAVNHARFSPCGRFVVIATHRAAAGKRCYRILVWSAVSGRICRWYDGHHGLISSLSWQPAPTAPQADGAGERRFGDPEGGDVLATGSWDGTVRLWRISAQPTGAGSQMLELDEHRGAPASDAHQDEQQFSGAVLSCAFRPCGGEWGSREGTSDEAGAMLLVGSLDGSVRVYDPETGDCLHDWEGHEGGVRAAAWSPCGRWAASAGEDGALRLWRAPCGGGGGAQPATGW